MFYEACLTYPLAYKRLFKVFETEDYLFLKLPIDPEFVSREGLDMQHCLAHAFQSYCQRMLREEIELYSMTHKSTNRPVITIEVALTKSSYSQLPITHPTVTQIRGSANQCPPTPGHRPDLARFLATRKWCLTGHGIPNFDGRIDGDVTHQALTQLSPGY